VLISADGRHIAALGPGGFKLWGRDPVHLIGAFRDPAGRANAWWFTAWAFSADGKTLAVSDVEGTVGLYDAERGDLARRLTVSESSVSSLAFSPDGRLLVTTSADHLVRVWDVVANRLLWVSPGAPIGFMRDVAFSPDGGKIAAVADDANVYVWDVSTGNLSNIFEDTLMASFGLAFTKDGKHLMVGGASSGIFLLNLSTGTVERTLGRDRNVVASLKLSPRGDMVASRYRNPIDTAKPAPIILWDIASGKAKLKLEIPNTHFDAMSWHESGLVVTSWSDGNLHVWTVRRLANAGQPR
jgi:WD40 repeat protein